VPYRPRELRIVGRIGVMNDASLAKTSGKHWLGSVAWTQTTPGYEENDLGFMTRADYYGVSELVLYQENQPGKLLRNWNVLPSGSCE